VVIGIPWTARCLHKLLSKINSCSVCYIIFANAIDKFIGERRNIPRTGRKGNGYNIYWQYTYICIFFYICCSLSSVGPKERYEIPRNAFSNLDRFLRSDRQPRRTSRYKDTRTRTHSHRYTSGLTRTHTHTRRHSEWFARLCVCACVMMLAASCRCCCCCCSCCSGYWMKNAAANI